MSYKDTVIKSDDPQAIEKLKMKLEQCQNAQEEMKKQNAYFKKHGTMVGYPDLTEEMAKAKDRRIADSYSWEKKPYPSYALQNNNQEINRLKKQIEELTQNKDLGFVGWEFEGGKAVPNTNNNRLQLLFDEKPSEEQRAILKQNGFRWAPSEQAWQRQLNSNAFYAANRIPFIQPKDNSNIIKIQPKAPTKDDISR